MVLFIVVESSVAVDSVHIRKYEENAVHYRRKCECPFRKKQWAAYLDWAIKAFRIAANGVRDETPVHSHMCYSEFSHIIKAIA